MTRRQKITRGLAVPCVAVLVAVPWVLHNVHQKNEEHARFYNAGKTVNDFLKSYCKGLEASFEAGDLEPLAVAYSQSYNSPGRGEWVFVRDEPLVDMTARHLGAKSGTDYGRDELAAELSAYLAGMTRVDETICKINMIEEVEFGHEVKLTVKFILDGVDQDGGIFQDRFFLRWWLTNEAGADVAYNWKIRRDELVEGVRVLGDGEILADVDPRELGIEFKHERDPKLDMKKYNDELEFAVIQHASGGLSAADYDSDGMEDLFLLGGTDCRLYRNEGPGEDGMPRFADVTAATGLEDLDQTHVALFADFDNDGDRDLFVGRYLAPSRYYENTGDDTYSDKSAAMGLDLAEPVTSATLLDYDRDGYVDVYLAVNGNAFEAFPRLPFFARNGRPNRLMRNDGGRAFVDVTVESGTGDTGWGLAVAATDFNDDGLPDLGVANDFGRKVLYRNNGPGEDGKVTFTDVAKEAGVLDFSGGMGLAFGDFDDDGRVDLYTSNINSNQRWYGEDMTVAQYTRNVMTSRFALLDFGEYRDLYGLVGSDWIELGTQIGEGNSLFRNKGDATFEELKDSHTHRAGWSWSVSFSDLDNDTDLDIYAANGWISNTPGTDL